MSGGDVQQTCNVPANVVVGLSDKHSEFFAICNTVNTVGLTLKPEQVLCFHVCIQDMMLRLCDYELQGLMGD